MDVVIGGAFGDEGKGLITHYLASGYGPQALVVRFNGGAQAGHTVVNGYGQRHVFKHVSSGTFVGAATYLSRFFVSNPILFLQEMEDLRRLGLKPKVYVDPDSVITTPYDMMINQIAEESRAEQRHGSCGVGFAETIERNLNPSFSLTVADLDNQQKTEAVLQSIRKKWLPQRLAALNISSVSEQWHHYIEADDIFQLFIHDLYLFLESITVNRLDLTNYLFPVIFEGAQGLMLDQERGWFPHVTRSHTGLKNVISLVTNNNNSDFNGSLNVVYVARSYLTRHGAGPLPYELSNVPYQKVLDKTNIPNSFQGSLRYAWFNLTLLKSFVQSDLNTLSSKHKVNHRLALTCLDQIDDQITFIEDNKVHSNSQESFLGKVAREMKTDELLCSYGPSVNSIKNWHD